MARRSRGFFGYMATNAYRNTIRSVTPYHRYSPSKSKIDVYCEPAAKCYSYSSGGSDYDYEHMYDNAKPVDVPVWMLDISARIDEFDKQEFFRTYWESVVWAADQIENNGYECTEEYLSLGTFVDGAVIDAIELILNEERG